MPIARIREEAESCEGELEFRRLNLVGNYVQAAGHLIYLKENPTYNKSCVERNDDTTNENTALGSSRETLRRAHP